MDTVGSYFWSSPSSTKAKTETDTPDASTLTIEELARLLREERQARKDALADTQKHLDWRFVHFADDFQRRLDELADVVEEQGRRTTAATATSFQQPASRGQSGDRLLPPIEALQGTNFWTPDKDIASEERLGILEGKLCMTDTSLDEVRQRLQDLESSMEKLQQDASMRFGEAEAWLQHLDRHVADVEHQLGGRRGAANRLTVVEQLALEGKSRAATPSASNQAAPGQSVAEQSMPPSNGVSQPTQQPEQLQQTQLQTQQFLQPTPSQESQQPQPPQQPQQQQQQQLQLQPAIGQQRTPPPQAYPMPQATPHSQTPLQQAQQQLPHQAAHRHVVVVPASAPQLRAPRTQG